MRAWPAHADSDFDGWRLRFADGYTRRANSITPLAPSRLAIEDKIDTCERLYADRGLPTIFRLTPFAPPELDDLLAKRGYRRGDRVQVRARSLAGVDGEPAVSAARQRAFRLRAGAGVISGARRGESARLRVHAVDPWLDIFGALSGSPAANRPAHRAVLASVPGVRRLQALWVGPRPVACGMGVLSDGLLGLFDLVTAAVERNRGFGSELLARTLAWGTRAGAAEAYLQVLAANHPARRIYERAGFEIVYDYYYREAP